MKITINTTGIEYWDGLTDIERLALFTSNEAEIPNGYEENELKFISFGKLPKAVKEEIYMHLSVQLLTETVSPRVERTLRSEAIHQLHIPSKGMDNVRRPTHSYHRSGKHPLVQRYDRWGSVSVVGEEIGDRSILP